MSDPALGTEFGDKAKPLTLYHCLYREPEGPGLRASCVREVNGREAAYLFAASHLSKALAFAFSYHDNEVIANGGIEGTDDEFVIVCDREKTLGKPRRTRVYGFPADGFEMAWEPESRQYVSTAPVAFKDTKLVLDAEGIEPLMRHGLQIFSTGKTAAELMAGDFFNNAFAGDSPLGAKLAHLVRNHGFTWENEARGVHPNPLIKAHLKADSRREHSGFDRL
jgi:hypothetical protein